MADAPSYYTPAKLNPQHLEICRLRAMGMKNTEICKELNISYQTVMYIVNHAGRAKIEELIEDRDNCVRQVADKIQFLSTIAVDVIEDNLLGEVVDEKKSQVAFRVLDRAGHGPVRKLKTENLHGYFTRDDLEKLKARSIAGRSGKPMIETAGIDIGALPNVQDK